MVYSLIAYAGSAEQVRQVRQLPDHLLAYPVHLYGAAMNT